jgi:hypothetical protein
MSAVLHLAAPFFLHFCTAFSAPFFLPVLLVSRSLGEG